MALKPDRNITNGATLEFFMNHVQERGGIVTHSTSGSGSAMDQSNSVVVGTGDLASGTVPAGLLMNDVVNLDLTRQRINAHKDEVQLGGKVTVLRHGTVTTNAIAAANEPAAGSGAYYASETLLGVTSMWVLTTVNGDENPTNLGHDLLRVGQFLSSKDEDGYVKVDINIT
jgi:hypothetical protein